MKKTSAVTLAVAVAVGALAGCGSTQEPGQPPAASSASSPPSAPAAPATWSKDEAGTRYLAIVKPFNDERKSFPTSTDASAYPQYVKACKRALPLIEAQMRDLEAGEWPANARPAIDDLIDESAELRTWFAACAKMKSAEDSWALPQLPPAAAAQKVRLKLGLPAPARD